MEKRDITGKTILKGEEIPDGKYIEILDNINKENAQIDSLYIEENNELHKLIVYDDLHELRSVSKLLIAMAMGIAIKDKLFSIDENVFKYFEKYINNQNNIQKIKKWTVKSLLTHTTGYDKTIMTSKYIRENNLEKDKLLENVLNYDINNEPNSECVYNNVEPFLISVLFKEKHNIYIEQYIDKNIFKKMDIKSYKWEKYGEYCPGCTGLYLYPDDFYKIGKLVLNDGKYENKQIIPTEWIKEMCEIKLETPNLYKKERLFPKLGIGYFIFLSRDNYIFRDGANGQYIIINKQKKLLICIMASEKDENKPTQILKNIF